LQAFNNVLHGRWKKIEAGYGKAVLGYFGKPPLAPDPVVVKITAEQLNKQPFSGDPLEAAPDSVEQAKQALSERNLTLTDENIFLVAASIVPGRNMELNEGIRLLPSKPRSTSRSSRKAGTPPLRVCRKLRHSENASLPLARLKRMAVSERST